MNFENILVIGICFVAIAVVAYYFYRKYTSQQNDMNALSKRFETIEMMFTTPPPQKELSDIYNRKYSTDPLSNQPHRLNSSGPSVEGGKIDGTRGTTNTQAWIQSSGQLDLYPHLQMEPLVPSKISCKIGLCDLQPLQLETNDVTDCETQIDKIVDVDNDDEIQKIKI
ncbi:MAG: hypothetical protein ACRCZ0_05715 [Cetobacterium sp.]